MFTWLSAASVIAPVRELLPWTLSKRAAAVGARTTQVERHTGNGDSALQLQCGTRGHGRARRAAGAESRTVLDPKHPHQPP